MDLRLEDLAVQFGSVRALKGVSIHLRPGEVSVLAGPNGSGKSTLMGVVLGLIRPDGGRVLANDRPVADVGHTTSIAFREQLGFLPESVAFSENLTGRQVLRFFASARGLVRARVEEVLERVGLAHAGGRSVGGYSRGMRQRLGLGIAILASPDLLVLDEPTGGLDQQGLTLLWEVLAEWREAGRMVLMSTHDLAAVERRADRVFVLVEGRLVASGTPSELRERSELERTVRVGPALDEIYDEILGGAPWAASHVH